MPGCTSSKPLTLNVEGAELIFNSPADFRYCLDSKTEMPGNKVLEALSMLPSEIKAQIEQLAGLEDRFVDLISYCEDKRAVDCSSIAALQVNTFSQDYDWRAIMISLRDMSKEHCEYKVVALQAYLNYLRKRRTLLEAIHAKRANEVEEQAEPDSTNVYGQTFLGKTQVEADAIRGGTESLDDPFRRLTRKEPTTIWLGVAESIPLRLSHCELTLTRTKHGWVLSEDENALQIREGRVSIGRDANCGFVVAADDKGVSREHLILQFEGAENVTLIDVSRYGTRVPKRILMKHGTQDCAIV